MPVSLINNAVMVPHAPNWTTRPRWRRRWNTSLGEGVVGAEDRQANRVKPRVALNWASLPFNLVERARMMDRVKAALKSGKAAAPFWGRGQTLLADVTAATVNVTGGGAWPWVAGEWVFFCDRTKLGEEAWDAIQVQSVGAGPVLTLAGSVSRTYRAGDLCWPVLFGKLSCSDVPALTSWHAEVPLAIEQPAGEGVFAVADCPPELPGWLPGGEAPGPFCDPWIAINQASVYVSGITQATNPNDVLSLEQINFALALWEIEFAAHLVALNELYDIKEIGDPFWLWQPGSSMQLSLVHKVSSGVMDPNNPEGDVSVLFNSGYYHLSQTICGELLA